ncbi:MAG: hypothetical protein ACQEVA_12800, partial [Myxococcota bacterium]
MKDPVAYLQIVVAVLDHHRRPRDFTPGAVGAAEYPNGRNRVLTPEGDPFWSAVCEVPLREREARTAA